MIVAILLAYLDRLGLRRHYRDVFLGVGAAMVLVLVGGVAAYVTLKTYAGSRTQTIFETGTYVLAAVVLTYMTFWMRRHAATMSGDLRERAEAALDGKARWGIALLSFQAVGREGLETMVFTLAIVFASTVHGVIIGGVAGLIASLVVAVAIYHLGRHLNIGLFFKTVGTLLMVFAAGILADAIENLQQLGWLPFLTHVVWNTSGVLSESSTFGDIVHTFFGYADRPSVLQIAVYGVYLVTAVGTFLYLNRRSGPPSRSSSGSTAAGAAVPRQGSAAGRPASSRG